MSFRRHTFLVCVLLLVSVLKLKGQFYNGSQLTFGKNRVQYIDRFWSYYRFEGFETYFYQQGKPLAIYTAKYFAEIKPILENKLQTQVNEHIQFVIFNKLTDLKQSNVGFISDEYYNTGGKTHIVGSKVFLYFDGDYEDFRNQIKAGFTHILINQLLYGEYFISMIKNSTLLSLPDWYLQGLISYISEEWNTELDNYIRDGIVSGRYNKFYMLDPVEATYAGHSFWYYIAQKYGEQIIPNILYMTRLSRSIESGFLYVLGISHKNLMNEWLNYFKFVYESEDDNASFPDEILVDIKYKKNTRYHSVVTSPNGRYMAYATNKMGKSIVWLYDNETNKKKRLLKQGHKLDEKIDLSYPLMDFHPSGELLTIMREEKGLTAMYFYDLNERKMEKRFLFHFDKVLSFSYAPNGRVMAISAVLNGKTNIFVYNLAANSFEIITNDSYNDFEPVFSVDNKHIYFSSNRQTDTISFEKPDEINLMPLTNKNVYAFNYEKKTAVLLPVSKSKNNFINPQVVKKNEITLLSDANGIYNRYSVVFDSAISHIDTTIHYRYFAVLNPITHYNRNILSQYINHDKTSLTDVLLKNGKNVFTHQKIDDAFFKTKQPEHTYFKKMYDALAIQKNEIKVVTDSVEQLKTEDTQRKRLIVLSAEELQPQEKKKVDIYNYEFEDVREKKQIQTEIDTVEAKNINDTIDNYEAFFLPRQRNHNVEYTIDQMVNQLDFSYLNASYQTFTGGKNPIFINPGFNALFKVGLTDLLEDNRIVGGFRFSLDFNQTEYLLSYEMLKKRLDKQITFYRQKMDDIVGLNSVRRNTTHLLNYNLRWPFSNVLSLRGTTSYRYDRGVYLSTDIENLKKPNVNDHWAGLKAEIVFDNTRNQGHNIFFGSRYKIFGEYFKNIFVEKTDLYVVGGDFRHYQKIYKNLIWANRLAASASFGRARLIYYMGGVDTWLFPKFNDSISVATDQNYVYQTLATNMRGFVQNIRNGNNFALINSELRLPAFKFFANKPLKSEFLNSFQLIGFFDIGTAWNGLSPYYKDNPFFTQVYESPFSPIKITVYTQKEPIVAGYGLGLRAKLFGYFLRADWAYGIDDGVVKNPVFYLSLSLDF